ncbi:MAG: hypothetical protein HY201_00425 [Nitrospirae bacterium]|nr:hypothetical protein [Candidatus Troglogloeales bacterium]
MVAKGHDFPGVTLAGIICADFALNFPDFRSSERTFQLLAQVAGRTGRGKRPGEVLIQTFQPEHELFRVIPHFEPFYHTERGYRKDANYPPFTFLKSALKKGLDAFWAIKNGQRAMRTAHLTIDVDPQNLI